MKRFVNKWQLALLVFVVSAASIFVIFSALERVEYDRSRSRVQQFAQTYAGHIRASSAYMMQKTQIISDMVRQNPQDTSWFGRVAAELCANDPAAAGMQLVPANGSSGMYPAGTNFLANKQLAEVFRKGREDTAKNGEPSLYGPIRLADGRNVMLGIAPVLIYDEGTKGFRNWGSSVILLRVPEVMSTIAMEQLADKGYAYRVRNLDGAGQEDSLIAESGSVGDNPVIAIARVPNGRWTIEIAPIGGWVNVRRVAVEGAASVLLAALLAGLMFFFLRLHDQREIMRVEMATDPLTQLSNRRTLMEILQQYCRRIDDHFLVCYMDLNGFKKVNDTYGHDIGDELIRAVAQRVKACLKPEDCLFRLGGDEFVAILNDEDGNGWNERIQQMEDELRRVFTFGEVRLHISVSVGCALFPQNSRDPMGLLKVADERMYKRKENFLAMGEV
jgi:diguanylate cyclase (GGDEF)-like protein